MYNTITSKSKGCYRLHAITLTITSQRNILNKLKGMGSIFGVNLLFSYY